MRTCDFCGVEISKKNDGMFIRRMIDDVESLKLKDSEICVECKKEIMLAGLMSVL